MGQAVGVDGSDVWVISLLLLDIVDGPVAGVGMLVDLAVADTLEAACLGQTVTVTAIPDEGYELGTLTVVDAADSAVAITGQGNDRYTFTMPASSVTVTATFTEIVTEPEQPEVWENPFTDVDEGDWFYDYVAWAWQNGLMVGTSDTAFDPEGTTTRGQIVTILWRLAGEPDGDYDMDYSDVPAGEWYAQAVAWASSEGIVLGYDGRFDPEGAITREQLAAILYRYVGSPAADESVLDAYEGSDEISDWAVDAMAWAVDTGLIQGDEMGLNPTGSATRAEIATILTRFVERV